MEYLLLHEIFEKWPTTSRLQAPQYTEKPSSNNHHEFSNFIQCPGKHETHELHLFFLLALKRSLVRSFSWWSIFIDPVWRLLVYSLYSSSSFCRSYAILCVDLDCTETMILPCLNRLLAGLRAVQALTRMILGKKKHHRIPNQLAINWVDRFLLVGFDVTISNWDHLNDSNKTLKIRSTIK